MHTGSCPTGFSQNLLSEPSFLPSLSGGDSIRDLKDPCQKRKGDRPGSTRQPVPFLTKPWAQPLQPTAPTGMRPLTTQVPQLCHPQEQARLNQCQKNPFPPAAPPCLPCKAEESSSQRGGRRLAASDLPFLLP